MVKDLFFALWFFIPAWLANTMPVFAAKIPGPNAPMDFGKTFRDHRVLGAHKTWRGLVSGVVAATIGLALQQLLVRHVVWAQTLTAQVDYRTLPTFILGPLFGVGVLGGDAIKSFFKRQIGIAPGHTWFPFDQIDYIVGALLATAPIVRLTLFEYTWLLIAGLVSQMLTVYIGYHIGLRERPI